MPEDDRDVLRGLAVDRYHEVEVVLVARSLPWFGSRVHAGGFEQALQLGRCRRFHGLVAPEEVADERIDDLLRLVARNDLLG
jgi:hypothetical protein